MRWFGRGSSEREAPGKVADRVRARYNSFRELLALNNESLEMMAGLQEDLQFVPPRRDVLGDRIATIFNRVGEVTAALERLTGMGRQPLADSLEQQRHEVERYSVVLDEQQKPRLAAWLSEITSASDNDAGSKAAVLGEIRNKVGLPVPDGFVLTTEAYRQYCGIPLWTEIRDATRDLDLGDLPAVQRISEMLTRRAMESELPRAVEVAIAARVEVLLKNGGSVAVRSSARGEGGARSYAGQFLSLLNVPAAQAVEAYKNVVAARFSERALFYRLSAGLREVDNPMAALFLLMVPARAAGIMYSRDPANPKSKNSVDHGHPRVGPGDRQRAHARRPVYRIPVPAPWRGGAQHRRQAGATGAPRRWRRDRRPAGRAGAQPMPSLQDGELHTLAEWAVQLEEHFHSPQDVEWVLGRDGRLWIVQSRPLVNVEASLASRPHSRPKGEPRLKGGRTIYPGRTSGPAYLVEEIQNIGTPPPGAVVFIRKPSPEIIEIFPRIAGLVAEWGNVAGHAAALLREFRIPSVFQMEGAFECLRSGDPVSLDAGQARVYPGMLWPAVRREESVTERYAERAGDPISARLLTLNLLDPLAHNFRPAGCKSAHDILRYCHEKAIEAMFEVNDRELERGIATSRNSKRPSRCIFRCSIWAAASLPPIRLLPALRPTRSCRGRFRRLWRGISHPGVTWTREMPTSLGDLASRAGNFPGSAERRHARPGRKKLSAGRGGIHESEFPPGVPLQPGGRLSVRGPGRTTTFRSGSKGAVRRAPAATCAPASSSAAWCTTDSTWIAAETWSMPGSARLRRIRRRIASTF